ncbi:MAG: adenylate/guanylate cyclase domain-containing protein [Candidatus Bathyarchaeia archaeon]
MFTDLAGYTALTQKNEALAMQLLEEHRRLVRPFFPKHNGREVKTIGDAFLVEFDSALEATRCAFDIQQSLSELNSGRQEDRRILLRVGIHLGDVIHDQNDVYGDAVNIASRIEPLAPPGGICVSQQVYDQIKNKFEFPLTTLGEKTLKNVSEPVEVYRVVLPWEKKSENESGLERSRIAVLPFVNMSPDPADEYFADGLTEELIDRLAQVRELEVIARTSVMNYKKKEKNVSQIAKELSVGSLVEGSVRKAGNRIRVTAQLINGATEGHLWSSHYDKNLDDIFAVQSEIAEKVAEELKVRLVDSEKQTLEKKPTENTEAYSAFLRGRELYREETEPSVRQALSLFEKAVELDPSFARAHVGIANCHNALAWFGEPQDFAHRIARASLKRALELDPNLPEAHESLAGLLADEDDLPGSEVEARRALELNPSLPEPYRDLMEIAAMKGEPDEMVRLIETGYRLDPVRPLFIYLLGEVYFWTGRDQEALEHWKKTEKISPAYTYRGLADYHLSKGDIGKAREYHAKVAKLITHPWVTYTEGMIDALAGDKEKATRAIKKLEEDAKTSPTALNFVAYVYHSLGDMDSYFEWMNKAVEAHSQIQSFMLYAPLLATASADPRFKELVEKVRKQTGLEK